MIRKNLTALILACSFVITSSASSVLADNTTHTQEIAEINLTDYIRELYPDTVKDTAEAEAFNIVNRIETGDRSSANLPSFVLSSQNPYVYYGSTADVNYYYNLLGYEYGFVELDLYMGIFNEDKNRGLFSNIKDFNAFKKEYVRVAEKAKNIANTLKRGSQMETAKAIYDYVYRNAVTKGQTDGYRGATGFYDGKAIVCTGFASSISQLCRFNGIKCNVITGTQDGAPHAWNKLEIDGKIYYADAARGKMITDNLDSSYVVDAEAGEVSAK